MSYDDTNDGLIFPVRDGAAQGTSLERKMLDAVGGSSGIKTRVIDTNDATVRLRTRGGHPEFVATQKVSSAIEQDQFIPDWLSGVMTSGGSLDGIHFGPYYAAPDSTSKFGYLPGAAYVMGRLAVPLDDNHFIPPLEVMEGPQPYSQYSVIQPYRYSGKIRALVQFLLGYGRIRSPSWYTGRLSVPNGVVSTERSNAKKQVSLGYFFADCHGIVVGSDGNPWLVWISSAHGVWIFDLPRIFNSDETAFLTALSNVSPSDTNGMLVWAMFKGIPTGERPEAGDLTQWVRSGCGYQLLTAAAMNGWSECGAVAEHIGWAFNYEGTEARCVGRKTENNGHDYTTLKYYKLTFTVGAKRQKPTVGESLAKLRKRMLKIGVAAHVRAKLLYMSEVKAAEVLNGVTTFDDVVNDSVLTTAPVAACTLISSGGFYPPSGEVKIWSDAAGGCVSFTSGLEPTNPADYAGPFHVFYDNSGTLHEVRWAEASGNTSSGPYCGAYDTRDATNNSSKTTTPYHVDVFNVYHYDVGHSPATDMAVSWGRSWNVTQVTETIITTANTNVGTCFVPCGDRESIVFAKKHTHNGGTHQYQFTQNHLGDIRRYDVYEVGAWVSSPPPVGTTVNTGGCTFTYTGTGDGDRIFVVNPLSYFGGIGSPPSIDSGEWALPCFHPASFSEAYGYQGSTDTRTNHTDPENPLGTFECVAIVGGALRSIKSASDTPGNINYQFSEWFVRSPDPDTEVLQVMRTTSNCLGQTQFSQCYDDLNSGHYLLFGSLPMVIDAVDYFQLNYIGTL